METVLHGNTNRIENPKNERNETRNNVKLLYNAFVVCVCGVRRRGAHTLPKPMARIPELRGEHTIHTHTHTRNHARTRAQSKRHTVYRVEMLPHTAT